MEQPKAKKVNFLNNKDMLKEIHKSKNSYSEYTDPKYEDYDIIVENLDDIFLVETQNTALTNKADRLSNIAYKAALTEYGNGDKNNRPKAAEFKIDPNTLLLDEIVFRVLTFEHIPEDSKRKKTPRSIADRHVKLNFYLFKHYIIKNNCAIEVGRSHSHNGKFSLDGEVTKTLSRMYILLVDRYSQRYNWRSYSYLDEMKGDALIQLSQAGLQFDEYKSDNPFSFFTRMLERSFTGVLNNERKHQDLRDNLLIDAGSSPSFSKQLTIEEEYRLEKFKKEFYDTDE